MTNTKLTYRNTIVAPYREKMNESNLKNDKPQKERRYDPELLKKGLRCDLDQYEMLKRCSEKKDMTKWNEWRKKNLNGEILLEGANFQHWVMKKVNLMQYEKMVSLKKANFVDAHLEGSNFMRCNLEGANFEDTSIQGALLSGANLKDANFAGANLKDVNLFGTNLENVNLYGANLEAANLENTALEHPCSIKSLYNAKMGSQLKEHVMKNCPAKLHPIKVEGSKP